MNLCCCYFLLEILFPPASIYNFLWISLSFFQPPSSSSRPLNNGVHHRLALSYFWFPCALSLGDLIHRFASVSFSTLNTQTNIIPNHFSVYEKLHTTIICHIYTYIWMSPMPFKASMPKSELVIFFFGNGLQNDLQISIS